MSGILTIGKTCNHPLRPALWDVNNMGNQLAKMTRGERGVTFVVESLENEGVWLDVTDFDDGDIECANQNVVICRGRLAQLLYRLNEGRK